MAIVQKLTEEELSLLEVIEDPIFLGEYLRTTSDGSSHKDTWPKKPFQYRWYQKDLLTDFNNISLVAGRAVGKCQPATSRIYVVGKGYTTIGTLMRDKAKMFLVYALDENKNIVQKRARIEKDTGKSTRRVITESGHTLLGSLNHPVLTEAGWKEIQDLNIAEDKVAVATILPHDSTQRLYAWEEMRYFGYIMWSDFYSPGRPIYPKLKAQADEFARIADYFDTLLKKTRDGGYKFMRKIKSPLKHHATYLMEELGRKRIKFHLGLYRIPRPLMNECLDSIKVFIESFFSMNAEITRENIVLQYRTKTFLEDIQEILLRFGVETKITQQRFEPGYRESLRYNDRYRLEMMDYRAYYRFLNIFTVPGYIVNGLPLPPESNDAASFLRFDSIKEIQDAGSKVTYTVFVHDAHNYISDNFFVHNSLVLEDKMVYEAVNPDLCYPETKERLLATSNQSQMDPIQGKLIQRFTNSKFLKALGCQINKSRGIFDFPQPSGEVYKIYTRIAGKADNNMVGLHLPRIAIDESQLFSIEAFTQARHQLNTWESQTQIWASGVPNSLSNSTLYYLDQKSLSFKKYRIPSHCNPYYSRRDDYDNLRQYGGEDSNDYQNLVLGRHGTPSVAAVPRECIKTEPFEFFSYRYNNVDRDKGKIYSVKLERPALPEKYKHIVLAVDPGYTDPTLAQILICDTKGVWRTHVRYRLSRIPTPEQAEIIDWLDNSYKFDRIALDLGAGGGGIQLLQELSTDKYKHKNFPNRIYGVRFEEKINTGLDRDGNELIEESKPYAGMKLAKMVSEGELVFSEIDAEGISQIERLAYQKQSNGKNKFFVLSETARERGGISKDDHIFASYVCFILLLEILALVKPKNVKLARARWI